MALACSIGALCQYTATLVSSSTASRSTQFPSDIAFGPSPTQEAKVESPLAGPAAPSFSTSMLLQLPRIDIEDSWVAGMPREAEASPSEEILEVECSDL